MKKLLALVICTALLCGCSALPSENVREKLCLPLTITVSLDESESVFTLFLREGECIVRFNAPETLSETEIVCDNQKTTVREGSFRREADFRMFPAPYALFKAVGAISAGAECESSRKGFCQYTIDGMRVLVYYDSRSGLITKIETEENERRFCMRVVSSGSYEIQGEGSS